ncbi:hypothetical protein [Rhodococcus sp. NPDC127528]|uniref:hypothetical protein n=1 Tax=unclassified Rhodococcus (in: high G+C Gram-positive bacteria) TaxID=192944 RepID=UPI00362D0825
MDVLAGRAAAATSGVAAGAHLVLAVLLLGQSFVLATVLGAMAGWCLNCARHLWHAPSLRTWTVAAAGGAAMLVAHAGSMAVMPLFSGPGARHHHGGSAVSAAPNVTTGRVVDLGGLMSASMCAVLVAEALLLAGAAVIALRNSRSNRDTVAAKGRAHRGAVRSSGRSDRRLRAVGRRVGSGAWARPA